MFISAWYAACVNGHTRNTGGGQPQSAPAGVPFRVLFVCLGNICRSPAAEMIFNALLAERGLQGRIRCDSCGAALVTRKDDLPEVVLDRLHVYHEQTEPLKDYYQSKKLLKIIHGHDDLADTTAEMNAALEEKKPRCCRSKA